MKKNLVLSTDKILRESSKEVSFGDKEIDQDLLDSFVLGRGNLGLSACQIGVPYRACLCVVKGRVEIMNNPVIKSQSDEKIVSLEGCLSFPHVYCKVKRSKEVTVEYFNKEWQKCESVFTDRDSCVVQHEIDHLDGIRMQDRAFEKTYKK